jgi:L-ribulose-5-phosphate 3-epimerase
VIPIAAITDEFSPDLETALQGMSEVGMTGAELRVVSGKSIIDFSDDEVDRVRTAVEARGMRIISIASPVLKCVLPDAPPIDSRLQQDVFGSRYTAEDQPRLTQRALEIAERSGARIIRVFSYWRTVDPAQCFDRIVSALTGLADQAAERGLVIGVENEHACNIATGEEAGHLLAAIDHPSLQVVWDPANASILGETPYPNGYEKLPAGRIVHVHAKDCSVQGHTPTWGPLGEMGIDWTGQISALVRDDYRGWISLETHWPGPGGDKFQASMICGRALRALTSGGRA